MDEREKLRLSPVNLVKIPMRNGLVFGESFGKNAAGYFSTNTASIYSVFDLEIFSMGTLSPQCHRLDPTICWIKGTGIDDRRYIA